MRLPFMPPAESFPLAGTPLPGPFGADGSSGRPGQIAVHRPMPVTLNTFDVPVPNEVSA